MYNCQLWALSLSENKENDLWHIFSSVSFEEKLQKLLSVNKKTKRHLGYHFCTIYINTPSFKGRFLVNDTI